MFDVFFISYHEQYADENFDSLKEKAPLAKRVDGVKGIFNAHKRAAELSKTKIESVLIRANRWLRKFGVHAPTGACLRSRLVQDRPD